MMRYDEKSHRISLSADELIAFSLHRLPSEGLLSHMTRDLYLSPLPRDYVPRTPTAPQATLEYGFSEGGRNFTLTADAALSLGDATDPKEQAPTLDLQVGAPLPDLQKDTPAPKENASAPHLTVARAVPTDPRAPSEELLRRARGELFLAAHMLFTRIDTPVLHARLLLCHTASGREATLDEQITREAAARFFGRTVSTLSHAARDAVDRVADRLPTLGTLPFPYPSVRESQNELMQSAFRTIRRRGRLYACAPTGTGKTAAVLYPALRALSEGSCERVFYLTPKTTTARAAADTLARFAAVGGCFRALVLAAKERLCRRSLLCRDGSAPCTAGSAGAAREEEACRVLLDMPTVPLTGREIGEVAARFGVCPYELSLRYSLFCDVIVCDYNYLFDPRVSLRRYFDRGGPYAILIDEAHDLLDRAREIYSAALTLSDMDTLLTLIKKEDRLKPLAESTHALRTLFLRTLDDTLRDEQSYTGEDGTLHGFCAQKEPPHLLIEAVRTVGEEGMHLSLDRRLSHALRLSLRRALRPLSDLCVVYDSYSARFETFFEREGEERRLRLLCLDPAALIDRALSRGESAVLFSATLQPLPYYRAVLGGDGGGRALLLESPFAPENLCVAIMDKLRTRYTQRGEGKEEVAAALYAMVSAKCGNYFIFCPSYAYMDMLADCFSAAHPEVSVLRQCRGATLAERNAFLARFTEDPTTPLVGFCVTGGVYSEGIDLVGTRLVGAAVISVALPHPSPERDAMAAYYGELYDAGREYAYIYPGMNRVLQAAGRVIRTENDRGVLLLIDDRFAEPLYRAMIPHHWKRPRLVGSPASLYRLFSDFWGESH